MDLEELETSKEHEGKPLIKVQEKPNSCGTRGSCVQPHTNSLVRLVFPNDTRIESQQFILLNNKGSFSKSNS